MADIVRPDGQGNKAAPSNPNGGYNATDRRRDKGDATGWSSVDSGSGPVSDTDFENPGNFPDSGVWKQT